MGAVFIPINIPTMTVPTSAHATKAAKVIREAVDARWRLEVIYWSGTFPTEMQ
jgi:hypothetical protein